MDDIPNVYNMEVLLKSCCVSIPQKLSSLSEVLPAYTFAFGNMNANATGNITFVIIGFLLLKTDQLEIEGRIICGLCLTAGHAYEAMPECINIAGSYYTWSPIFVPKPFQLPKDRDPISGSALSVNADFFGFVISPLVPSLQSPPLHQTDFMTIPPNPGSVVTVEGRVGPTVSIEVAAPWARTDSEISKAAHVLNPFKGKFVNAEGDAIRTLKGVTSCRCSTLAGMSGGPLMTGGKAVGLLHGGPVIEAHHVLTLAREKLKVAVTKEDILAIKRLIEDATFYWDPIFKVGDEERRKLDELKAKALASFGEGKFADSIMRKLFDIYLELLGACDPRKFEYNVFISFDHKELKLFSNCCKELSEMLSKATEPVKYHNIDHFRHTHFAKFLVRNLKFAITNLKIGVRIL